MDESAIQVFTVAFSVLKAAFWLALPFALLSLIVGLVAGILQTGTSVSDQSISNVPKLVGTALLIIVIGSWVMNSLIVLTMNLFGDFTVFTGG